MRTKLKLGIAVFLPMLGIGTAAWAAEQAAPSAGPLRLAQQQEQDKDKDKEHKPGAKPGAKPAAPHVAPQRPAVQHPPMQPQRPAVQAQPPKPAPHLAPQPPRPSVQQHPAQLPHPTVQGQPPKPVIQGQPPHPTVQGQPPKPTVQGQPPKPLIQGQPPKPTVQGQPPKPLIQGQPPKPTVQGQPPKPLIQGQPPHPVVQGQPPKPGIQGQPPHPVVQGQPPKPTGQPPKPVVQGQPLTPGGTVVHRIDQLRSHRQEVREGNKTVIKEPGRTIVREQGHAIIRHDEMDRFRRTAPDVRVERRGRETFAVVDRPDGDRIITVLDEDGRLLRRIRRTRDGREVVIIDNTDRGRPPASFYLNIAPPVVRIPRDRYIVDADRADERLLYDTLIAPPVERLARRYTLDEIRFNHAVREWMPRIDLDTVTFDSGSWDVAPDQAERLAPIAQAIKSAIRRNPNEVFLVEGHTDATGDENDNLSLSDRRAETVASVLTEDFGVPPENLTTQGYGEQYLKVPTDGPERRNRRVTIRRITPLLTGQNP